MSLEASTSRPPLPLLLSDDAPGLLGQHK